MYAWDTRESDVDQFVAPPVEGPSSEPPREFPVVAPLQPRFYRLSVSGGGDLGPLRIESTRVENGEVVLNYGW